MKWETVTLSEGRKNLSSIVEKIHGTGNIYVFTVHGDKKVAMLDAELIEEFMEHHEYGTTPKKLIDRSNEENYPISDLKL
jgi:PHD/YefM family antitoxin component YafN of YafNO toxin-antitoxin module